MIAKDLISQQIPPLKTSDTGTKAMNWMVDFHVTHLPIVNNAQFLGLISEEDILDLDNAEEALGAYELTLKKPFIYKDAHIYEALKVFVDLQLSVLPVIDANNTYLGLIGYFDLLKGIARMASLSEAGSIIVLETSAKDHVLGDLIRIVEAESVKVLSLFVNQPNPSIVEVTLKLNSLKISRVVATLKRFNYTIKASFLESDYIDTLNERYHGLMTYLNV